MTPEFLDHCAHPRNVGDLVEPTGVATCENPACGDVATVAVRVVGSLVEAMTYRVEGCPASIACLSAISEIARELPLADVSTLDLDRIESVLGPLPAGRAHAADLALETLRAALDASKNASAA